MGFGFSGVIPILQTPFHDDGSLDLESLAREVDYVCALGAPGMAFPGFVSEWWKLSQPEIFAAAEVIRGASRGRAQVIFNVTAQSTYLAVQEAKRFVEIGCDGLMCLPPFVVPRGPAAVLQHLKTVLGAAPVPHILQYSSSLTGLQLSTPQILDLRREFPHFCCIKVDMIPPGPMISQLVDALAGAEFTFLIGFAGLQLAHALRRGAHGLMGGTGHVKEDLAVFDELKQSPDSGRGCFDRLLPLLNFEMQTVDSSIALHKRMLQDRGVIISDHIRAPGPYLDAHDRSELADILARLA